MPEGFRNPFPTVDVVIPRPDGCVLLVCRRNPPHGWALPGGFIDRGESAERAARREALEETGLSVEIEALLGVYSEPERDPRHHTLTVVYVATETADAAHAGDDAAEVAWFDLDALPPMAFDHESILADYGSYRATGSLPTPR
jgi:8-oxo-dGTP diphosphatase